MELSAKSKVKITEVIIVKIIRTFLLTVFPILLCYSFTPLVAEAKCNTTSSYSSKLSATLKKSIDPKITAAGNFNVDPKMLVYGNPNIDPGILVSIPVLKNK